MLTPRGRSPRLGRQPAVTSTVKANSPILKIVETTRHRSVDMLTCCGSTAGGPICSASTRERRSCDLPYARGATLRDRPVKIGTKIVLGWWHDDVLHNPVCGEPARSAFRSSQVIQGDGGHSLHRISLLRVGFEQNCCRAYRRRRPGSPLHGIAGKANQTKSSGNPLTGTTLRRWRLRTLAVTVDYRNAKLELRAAARNPL